MKTYANQSATADDLWRSFKKAIDGGGNAVDDKNVDELAQFHLEVVDSIANWTHLAGYPVVHVSRSRILKLVITLFSVVL